MITLLRARFAAVGPAHERYFGFNCPILAVIAVALSGCMPATARLAGADPADPAANVARAGYRSTIAPYTSLRPAAPAPWRAQNDAVAPKPKPDR